MYATSIILTAFAALAAAAPTEKRQSTYYGIGLEVKVTDAFTQPPRYEPAPVEIDHLTSFGNVSASEILFTDNASNVDINKIECRAYKDADGVVPGSAPFTKASPAELSTSLVEVGSVLCYIVE